MVHSIAAGKVRPQMILGQQIKCSSVDIGSTCNDLCQAAILGLKENGNSLYELVQVHGNTALEAWDTHEGDF
jgi:hypothetical protein